ncbi:MAG: hypothetical protein AAF998_29240, partial [Bacteroidota bacterium]
MNLQKLLFCLILHGVTAGGLLGQSVAPEWIRSVSAGNLTSVNQAVNEFQRDMLRRDAQGNIYSAGAISAGTHRDASIVKYDPAGNVLYTAQYDSGLQQDDQVLDLQPDGLGNLYVSGRSANGSNFAALFLKLDANGQILWDTTWSLNATSTDGVDEIVFDSQGNVYFAATSFDGNYHYTLHKLSPGGNILWSSTYSGGTFNFGYPAHVVIDSLDGLYLSGQDRSPSGQDDIALIKYDTSGNQIWVRTWNSPVNGLDYNFDLINDGAGGIILGGAQDLLNNDRMLLLKYDFNGNLVWDFLYGNPDNQGEVGRRLAIDDRFNIYLGGEHKRPGNGFEFQLLRVDSSGSLDWVQTYLPANTNQAFFYDVQLDSAANVYAIGWYDSGANGQDLAAIKLDASGSFQWDFLYDHGGGQADRGYIVEPGEAGKVYLKGVGSDAVGLQLYTIKLGECALVTANLIPSAAAICLGDTLALTNASQNAIDFQWTINGNNFSTANDTAWLATGSGSVAIGLIASLNNCADTAQQSVA